MEDLVSVIVPIFNSEKYIRFCLESIINQTHKNMEVMLINDGSTDNSAEICNTYSRSDSRIRVINTKNNGPASARNVGIKESTGDFIFFIDSDDFLETNAINLLIESFKQHRADIIVGGFNKIKNGNSTYGDNGFFPESKLLTKKEIIDYAMCYLRKPNRFPLFAHSWGMLFKSTVIKNNNILFNPDLRTFEDVAFNFDYLRYAKDLYFLKTALYNHLLHDNYASATMKVGANPKSLFGYKQAVANIGEFLKYCNSDADIEREVGHADICLTIIQMVRTCGQIDKSNKKNIYWLIREIIFDPDVRKNLKFYNPTKGDSRIIPILMKLRLVWPVIFVCMYKARKRYRK